MDGVVAEQQKLLLRSDSGDLELDVYRIADGELWIGVQSAAQLLGYTPDKLRKITEVVQDTGFTGEIKKVVIGGDQKRKEVQTVSLSDFGRLILYAALQGKKQVPSFLSLAITQSFAAASVKQKDIFRQLVDSLEDVRDSEILRRAVKENDGFTSLESVVAAHGE
jgi:hypothetical protein